MRDPIVHEVRRDGEAYMAKFDFNLKAVFDDLRRRSAAAGRQTVTRPARRIPRVETGLRKKVG